MCSDTWPWQQWCQIWAGGHWQHPCGLGGPSTEVGHIPLSIPVCEHHAGLRVSVCCGWQGKDRAVPSLWLRQGPFRAAKGTHATGAAAAPGAGSRQYLP